MTSHMLLLYENSLKDAYYSEFLTCLTRLCVCMGGRRCVRQRFILVVLLHY